MRELTANIGPAEIGRITLDEALVVRVMFYGPEGGETD
jgi:hypothetical protein